MDEIARLPARDRADLFSTAATQRGDMLSALVEKDFWVCWTLKRVFTLKNPPARLIFKGGTSLSKVYQAIDRFSEDVDLSFDRSALGFGGEKDPARASSRNQTEKRLEALSAACQEMIRTKFISLLEATFQAALDAAPSKNTWRVELDKDDPDQQTVLFHYLPGIPDRETATVPNIRLELGARGEQWPAEQATVTAANICGAMAKTSSRKLSRYCSARLTTTTWSTATHRAAQSRSGSPPTSGSGWAHHRFAESAIARRRERELH